jgi:hypothetical protein
MARVAVGDDTKPTVERGIRHAYRLVLLRSARLEEVEVLSRLYEEHLNEFRSDPQAATAAIHVGEHPVPADIDVAELAAWTSVARVILNLHETITRS